MSEPIPLPLREFHESLGAKFTSVNGAEVVADYGDALAEHAALTSAAGVLDLSFRSRVCLTGTDRVRFLHGQVTNDVKRLKPPPHPGPLPLGGGEGDGGKAGAQRPLAPTGGEGGRRPGEGVVQNGCYAALVTAKGKMESDLHIHCLADELLLDFEPGLTSKVTQRLEKFIVADDVQVVDVAPHYGLLSVQGPKAEEVVRSLGVFGGHRSVDAQIGEPTERFPPRPYTFVKLDDSMLGEVYLVNLPRIGGARASARFPSDEPSDSGPELTVQELKRRERRGPSAMDETSSSGFDLYVPSAGLGAVLDKLVAAVKGVGGRACGWTALETARIEAGIPRFGADMDETNIPIECGIESRAISYKKGCYIGQEVINRIHSIGHVNRELRALRLANGPLPVKGDKLFHDGKEVGHITSAVTSPSLKANIALGYVRREAMAVGTELVVKAAAGELKAKVVELPFGR